MKVKVKRSSWHYRLLSFIYADQPPNNLCWYFWKLVFVFPWILCVSFFALILLVLMLSPLLQFFIDTNQTLVFLGGFFNIVILVGALDASLRDRREEDYSPNIAIQWMQGKKQKVCPFLEFE